MQFWADFFLQKSHISSIYPNSGLISYWAAIELKYQFETCTRNARFITTNDEENSKGFLLPLIRDILIWKFGIFWRKLCYIPIPAKIVQSKYDKW